MILVLSLIKKMKDKYSHYFCRSRKYIEIHNQSRRHATSALRKKIHHYLWKEVIEASQIMAVEININHKLS